MFNKAIEFGHYYLQLGLVEHAKVNISSSFIPHQKFLLSFSVKVLDLDGAVAEEFYVPHEYSFSNLHLKIEYKLEELNAGHLAIHCYEAIQYEIGLKDYFDDVVCRFFPDELTKLIPDFDDNLRKTYLSV